MILELVIDGEPYKDPTKYERTVKCTNCLAEYVATIPKGTLVSQHECYNCGQRKLKPN